MNEELMPCPIPDCERDVEATEDGVFCICGYRLDHELADVEGESVGDTIERHNTLARRAEIGRLVERLVDGRCLSVEDSGGDWITASLVQIVDGREVELGEVQGEVGLLAALRALAKEVGGDV